MNSIEDILKCVSQNDIEIPIKVQNRINLTLRNKKIKKSYLRRFVTVVITMIFTIIGTFTVYAVTGGTIDGIPATDWLGIKFSSKYIEYKQPIENQVLAFDDTSVELVSAVCNEGFTILEFSLKLSENDYKKLKINENAVTDEYLKMQEANKNDLKRIIEIDLKNKKLNQEWQNGNYDITSEEIVIEENEIESVYKEKINEIENNIRERENSKLIPVLSLNCEQKGGTFNYDKFNPNMDWYASIYIDDMPYYVRNFEKTEKITDYEYRIYTLYMLDEDVLDRKNEFKITLKNNKLSSIVNWVNYMNSWRNDCQWFAKNNDSEMMKTPRIENIDLPGKFEITVSKNNILNDSVILDNPGIKSEFRNITHTVEKVVLSPIQTIVRINHSATQQSSNAFANRYQGKPNVEHLPLTREYKVYDDKGNEISCFSTTNKNTLIYADGTREDYDYHDVPNKKYSNAIWENIQYLLIENVNTTFIKIVPVETIRNPIDENDERRGEIYYEMEPLIINIAQ